MTWPPRGDDSFLQRSLRVAGWKVMKAYLSKCFEFGRYFFFFFFFYFCGCHAAMLLGGF